MLKLPALRAPFELFDDSRSPPGFAPGAHYDANTATKVLIEERNALVEIDIPLVFTANHYFFKSSVLREPTDEYCPYLFAPCDCSRTKIVRHGQTLQVEYQTMLFPVALIKINVT